MEAYARTLQEQRRALAELQRVQGELEAAWADWHGAVTEGCVAGVIAQAQRYFQTVEGRRQQAAQRVKQCEREVQSALQSMLVARREREAVDAFFENQRLAYDRELQREERKLLDDMAQRRAGTALIWSAEKAACDD